MAVSNNIGTGGARQIRVAINGLVRVTYWGWKFTPLLEHYKWKDVPNQKDFRDKDTSSGRRCSSLVIARLERCQLTEKVLFPPL
jgi:hypothetical protein